MHPCRSSRRIRVAALLAPALVGAMAAVASASAAVTPAPLKMADAFLIENTGKWFCPALTTNVACNPSRGSQAVGEELATRSDLSGVYMRVAKSRNECKAKTDPCTDIGVPDNASPEFGVLSTLKSNGVRLGIVLSAGKDLKPPAAGVEPASDDEDSTVPHRPRSIADIAWHACQITMADKTGLYAFMFLDLAATQKPAARLKRLVRMIRQGKVVGKSGRPTDCPDKDRGWPQLITNDTNRNISRKSLDSGAWAHAKRLEIMHSGAPEQATAAKALMTKDRKFVKTVNGLGSRAVLRLEVTPDTSKFAKIAQPQQCLLLNTWARKQHKALPYTFLFPLYVHGAGPGAAAAKQNFYDSFAQSTFERQIALMTQPQQKKKDLPKCGA